MVGNANLNISRREKNDEFYTQYSDIEEEISAYVEFNRNVFRNKTILLPCDDYEHSNFTKYFVNNFKQFGLKKLISTSYSKASDRGKIFTITADTYNVEFSDYLEGNGDFRSSEVSKLRDEVDIIITNPPFSMYRIFLAWIMEAGKRFIIMSNKNSITYKEVFPLLKENKIWVGSTSLNGGRWMILPSDIDIQSKNARVDENGNKILNIAGVCWFTNIEHGRRHKEMQLNTMEYNLKFNNKLREKFESEYGVSTYPHYDNYGAIEVPFVECIPSDYSGIIGAPITFIDKYNPEQFEIVGATESEGKGFSNGLWNSSSGVLQPLISGKRVYKRIFIRHKRRERVEC